MPMSDQREAERLERLWAGEFGDAYRERNADAGQGRQALWTELVGRLGPANALEVGCNIGGNLRWLTGLLGEQNCAAIDISEAALATVRERMPGVDARLAQARDLPFGDGSFDLVFTVGVLIHQPSESLRQVMSEVVRCSRRWVLCVEYADSREVEVPYRGERGALYRRDYGGLYEEWFPELTLVEQTDFPRGEDAAEDEATIWTFEK